MKTLLITLMIALPLWALTLDEAIERTLKNHPLAAQSEAAQSRAAANAAASRAGFYPALSLGASQTERDHSSNQPTQSLSVRASINLFNGFRDRGLLKGAQAQARAAEYERRATRADLRLAAARAFFAYHRAAQSLKTRNEAALAAARQAEDAEAFYEEGLIALHELMQLRLQKADADQRLLAAKSALRLARNDLSSLMGTPLESEPEPFELNRYEPVETPHHHLAQRSELRALQALRKSRQAQAQVAASGFYPSLDASITQERYEYDADTTGPDEQQSTTLSLNWSLFSGFSTLKGHEAARHDVRVADHQIAELKRQLDLQLSDAQERLRLSDEALRVAQVALQTAGENHRMVQNRFESQLATATELVDARAALWAAKEQVIAYHHDRLEAIARLERTLETPLLY
jgi:outer membrane protein TolC